MKKMIAFYLDKLGYRLCKKETYAAMEEERERLHQQVNAAGGMQYLPLTSCGDLVRHEFSRVQFAGAALQKVIDDYAFETVLDIGAGAMHHSEIFARYGKKVTAVDYGVSVYYRQHVTGDGIAINKILGDFNHIDFGEVYDCVWASHVLEHQVNTDDFLKKVVSLTREGGVIAITVPPFKHDIVGGHVSLWNAGLLLYRLVLAGVDCSTASVMSYGYNISVIVRKKTVSAYDCGIEFDCGDIRRIKHFLPKGIKYFSNESDDPFNGNIAKLNW